MQQEALIPTELIIRHHRIQESFLHSLRDYGLIELTEIESGQFVDSSRLNDLERMIRLHYELQINLEGIDAITHLMARMESLQDELKTLRNRLRFYGEDE